MSILTKKTVKRISIITICKNSERTVGKTIESIISQKSDVVEYIIVDGFSSDKTTDIIKSFGDDIDIFLSEPDNGVSDAFNKGIALASGEIIGLINSDDKLLPGAIEKILRYFTLNSSTDIVHGDILLCEKGTFIKRIKPPRFWWIPWRLIFFNHPSTFVKKKVYDKFGKFDDKYKIAMDVDLFAKWLRAGLEIAYLPESLVAMEAQGVSGRQVFRGFFEKRRILIGHAFPRFLVELQFIMGFLVQIIIMLLSLLRKTSSNPGNAKFVS